MACYLTSPAVERQVRAIVAAEAPDLARSMPFPAALMRADEFGCRSAVMLHTFIFRQLEMWRRIFTTFSEMRQGAGFSPLPSLDELWRPRELLVSTSLAAFDAPPEPGWSNVVHVGPSLENERFAVQTPLPWADDDLRPLVLVSFSTGFEQRNLDKVQRTLDALAEEPARVVATTGGIVAPNEVAAPPNAIVINYAAHDPILSRARLVIGHGGHGTAMLSFATACRWRSFRGWRATSPLSRKQSRNGAQGWHWRATRTLLRYERRPDASSTIRRSRRTPASGRRCLPGSTARPRRPAKSKRSQQMFRGAPTRRSRPLRLPHCDTL